MPHQSSTKHSPANGDDPVAPAQAIVFKPVNTNAIAAGPPPQSFGDDAYGALKSIAEIGSLFLALSFVGGWSFMSSYYSAFGVNSSEFDFSVPVTSAFAVHMLRTSGWPMMVAIVFLAGLAVFYGKLGVARRAWTGAFMMVTLFVVATASSLRGRHLAAEDIYETSPRLPNVGFFSKNAAQEPDCLSKGTTDCKLLLHSKGAYYFFEPLTGTALPSKQIRNVKIYVVQDSEIYAAQIVRGVE